MVGQKNLPTKTSHKYANFRKIFGQNFTSEPEKFGRFVQFHYILIRNFSYLTSEMEQSYLNITLDGIT